MMLLIRLGRLFGRMNVGIWWLLEALGCYELSVLSSRDRHLVGMLLRKTLAAIVEPVVLIWAGHSSN